MYHLQICNTYSTLIIKQKYYYIKGICCRVQRQKAQQWRAQMGIWRVCGATWGGHLVPHGEDQLVFCMLGWERKPSKACKCEHQMRTASFLLWSRSSHSCPFCHTILAAALCCCIAASQLHLYIHTRSLKCKNYQKNLFKSSIKSN